MLVGCNTFSYKCSDQLPSPNDFLKKSSLFLLNVFRVAPRGVVDSRPFFLILP